MSNDYSRLREHNSVLHNEVRTLRRKALRAPEQRSRAVNTAVAKAADELRARSNTWRIKRPDGRIENWVRDLSCRLIAVHHLPASHTPGAISDVLQAIRANTSDHDGSDNSGSNAHVDLGNNETFSDRSARRFPLEGHFMGKIRAAEEFKAAPG
jgi:hypothetical protein